MKYQTYQFKEGDVELKFSFEDNDRTNEQKIIFIKLMEQATQELNSEKNN